MNGVLAALFGFVALSSWAVSSPIASSPDDDYHIASIWCAGGFTEELCRQGEISDEVLVPRSLVQAHQCFAGKPEQAAACQADLTDLSSANFMSISHVNIVEHAYPNGYYLFHRMFASSNAQLSTLVIREINSIIAVLLVSLLIFAFPLRWAHIARWGWIVSLVPLGMFIIPSINPSSWSVTSGLCLLPALLGIPRQESRKKRVLLMLVAIAAVVLGAFSRNDSAIYTAITLCIGAFMSIGLKVKLNWKYVAFVSTLLISVLAFYFGMGPKSGPSSNAFSRPEQQIMGAREIFRNLKILLPELWTGSFGTSELGWLDTSLPVYVSQIMLSVLLLVFLRAIIRRNGIQVWLGIFFLVCSLIAIPSFAYIQLSLRGFGPLQARYIYPLVIALICALLFAASKESFRKNNLLNWVVIGGIGIANAASLFTNLHRYVSASQPFELEGLFTPHWWWQSAPFSPFWVGIIGSISFLVAASVSIFDMKTKEPNGLFIGPFELNDRSPR